MNNNLIPVTIQGEVKYLDGEKVALLSNGEIAVEIEDRYLELAQALTKTAFPNDASLFYYELMKGGKYLMRWKFDNQGWDLSDELPEHFTGSTPLSSFFIEPESEQPVYNLPKEMQQVFEDLYKVSKSVLSSFASDFSKYDQLNAALIAAEPFINKQP